MWIERYFFYGHLIFYLLVFYNAVQVYIVHYITGWTRTSLKHIAYSPNMSKTQC